MTQEQIKYEDDMNSAIVDIHFLKKKLKKLPFTREKALAIIKLDEARLWLAEDLTENPSSNIIIKDE